MSDDMGFSDIGCYGSEIAVTPNLDALAADGVGDPDTPRGPGLAGDPGSSFEAGIPGTVAQTAEERARDGKRDIGANEIERENLPGLGIQQRPDRNLGRAHRNRASGVNGSGR